jgi:hypothetical protein
MHADLISYAMEMRRLAADTRARPRDYEQQRVRLVQSESSVRRVRDANDRSTRRHRATFCVTLQFPTGHAFEAGCERTENA